jgi:hypothetical protein
MERESRAEKKKRAPGDSMPYWMVKRRNGTGGGMAVHAATALDAVKEVAKGFDEDPIDLYAIPMAEEELDQRGSTIFVMKDDNGKEYRQRANISREARNLVAARYGIKADSLTVVATEQPPEEQSQQPGVDTTGDFQLVNSNRSIDTRMRNVDMTTAMRTARNMEQEYGLESGSIHVTRITGQTQSTTGAAGHNWRIYDVRNPDLFTVVAADSRTNAAERWAYVNPERPADMVDAVPDEGAMKYEFSIAQQALNPNPRNDNDRFIYPQEIYRQRTSFTEMPVRRVWATSKEQAIGKVRSFFHNDFWDIPEEWLKINVVGI